MSTYLPSRWQQACCLFVPAILLSIVSCGSGDDNPIGEAADNTSNGESGLDSTSETGDSGTSTGSSDSDSSASGTADDGEAGDSGSADSSESQSSADEGDSDESNSGEDSDSGSSSSGSDDSDSESGDSSDSGDDTDESADSSGDSSDEGEGAVLFLIIDPHEQTVEVDLNTPTSVPYTVTAYHDNGDSTDVTEDVEWETTNPPFGSMVGSNLDIPAIAVADVGTNFITATLEEKSVQAKITIAAYDHSNDFFFTLEHNDSSGSDTDELEFATDVQAMDVFFNMDTTGSMGDEIGNLKGGLNDIISTIQAEVPNTQFGVGRFDDFPISPFGNFAGDGIFGSNACGNMGGVNDQPFTLLQTIVAAGESLTNAVNSLTHRCGGDVPESWIESMYQIATGDGLGGITRTSVPANNEGIGGVAFREGTIPVIVSITDAVSHAPHEAGNCNGDINYSGEINGVAHTRQQTKDALDEICARSMMLASLQHAEGSSCSPIADGNDFALSTGTRIHPDAWDAGGRPGACDAGKCCTGQGGTGIEPDADNLCPLVFRVGANGSGVSDSIAQGIQMVAQYTPFDVSVEVIGKAVDEDGNPLPAGKTTADFIKSVTPNRAGAPPLAGLPNPRIVDNTFENVTPGTPVFFDVEAFNDFIPEGSEPQRFAAEIRVLAGDCSVELDSRVVQILVPAKTQ